MMDEYDYQLPDERIAKYPLEQRDQSRLLVYQHGQINEDRFNRSTDYLPENALLVYNNTRVIQARMIFRKETGAQIEVFCLEPVEPSDYVLALSATQSGVWKCMVGNLKKWKSGPLYSKVSTPSGEIVLQVERLSTEGNTHSIRFSWDRDDISFAEILDNAGELPIPPYLHRDTEEQDKTSYQTVYSKIKGSVAAPTAGLHFTPEVFKKMAEKGIQTEELTLHVGAGTFQPVKSDSIADHEMHTEVISVPRACIERLLQQDGKTIAVGTTSVRTLESLYYIGVRIAEGRTEGGFHVLQWEPYQRSYELTAKESLGHILSWMDAQGVRVLHAQTQILIQPGFRFRVIDGMFTNFHQPKSTLLLLVSAFTGADWKKIYDYALKEGFRFLSYGDSSLLLS